MKQTIKIYTNLTLGLILLSACQSTPPASPEPATEPPPTSSATQAPTEMPATPADTPVPAPDTLVICVDREPQSLYFYDDASPAARHIWEAIYDGPIDNVGYRYEPVILEKIPSLVDGDASSKLVTVSEGDLIVDDGGEPTELAEGVTYRPSGCNSGDCALEYKEGEILMDQFEVTFRIQRGVLWSDGAPVSAHDSVYSYQLNAAEDTPASKYLVERTASYTAQDDLTAVWKGLPGFIDPNYSLNFWTPAPMHLWDDLSAAELVSDPRSTQKPVGWGPYQIQEWNPGQNMILTKNPFYFRSPQGLPYFDTLVIRFVGNNGNNNIASLMSGECDILEKVEDVDYTTLLELHNNSRINAISGMRATWTHLDFGINPAEYDDGYDANDEDRPALFSDTRTRQGIAMCLDRQQAADAVTFGLSEVMHTYLPAQHPLYNPDASQNYFNPGNGVAFLEAAGWVPGEDGIRIAKNVAGVADGTLLSFRYMARDTLRNQRILEIFTESALLCGIKLIPDLIPPADYYADGPDGRLFGRQFDVAQFTWRAGNIPACINWSSAAIPGDQEALVGEIDWLSTSLGEDADPDGEAFPFGWGGWNVSGFASPQFDTACQGALISLPGQPSFIENHLLAQRIFSDEIPVIPLFPNIQLSATRPDLCGFSLDPTAPSPFWNLEEYGIGSLCR